ncbi:hypothetical protein A2U01_0104912, partial [Trifolium medium]|nr:hypothetical protein [Trifolium medium]
EDAMPDAVSSALLD